MQDDEIPDFEDSVEELEGLVQRLEHGGGKLEEALEDYSKAIRLIKSCHARLEKVERQVEILSGVDAQGNPVTQPVSETEDSLEHKQGTRGDRRTAKVTKVKAPAAPQEDEGGLF